MSTCHYTHRVHPLDVGGHTGEDSRLLVSIASRTRHKAGNAMDVVFVANHAVQRTAGVTLRRRETNEINT